MGIHALYDEAIKLLFADLDASSGTPGNVGEEPNDDDVLF